MENEDELVMIASLSPTELKALGRDKIHENYKKLMCHIIKSFYMDLIEAPLPNELTAEDFSQFVEGWVEGHLKPARDDWNVE